MPTIDDYRNKFPSLRELDDAALIARVAEVQGVDRGAVAAHMGYKPKARGMLSALNDTVIEGANAVAGGVKSVGDFVAPGNPVSQFIDENIIKAGEAKQSDVVKAEKARYRAEMEGAEGIGDEVGATLGYVARNPVQSLAQAAGSFVLPGAAVKGGGMLASMAGAGAKGATRAGLAGGAVAGAALSGGDAAGTAYELVKKAGGTDEQATEAARKASVLPAAIGAAGGVVGAERLLAGAKGFGGGTLSRALKTAGVEGAQEAIEEGVTQYEGQAAAVPFDPTIDPTKGVAGAATMGAVLGGATGGAVSLLSGKPSEAPRVDPVVSVLAAPSVDDAINAAKEAVGAKPARRAQAPAELPQMDPDDRSEVLGLLQVVNRPGVSPNVARFAQSRMDELLVPYRDIPAGEATEMLPVPDARELTDEERAEYVNAVPFSYQWAVRRGLPQPEVTELLPTGDATEVEPIPVGDAFEAVPAPEAYEMAPAGEASELLPTPEVTEFDQVPAGDATELDAETIQADDFLARDGEPFTSKTGAQAKAYASGGGKVVAIPDHFGSGIPGFVVRPLVQGRPSNTRGTEARDLPRSSNVNQPDVAGTAAVASGPADGASDQRGGSGGTVGRVADDGRARAVDAGLPAPAASGNADQAAGPTAGNASPALTTGDRITLSGKSYTVVSATPSAVKLDDGAGGTRMVARNSKTFGQIQPTTGNPMLDNPASWVIREKATGKVVMETFDRAKVDALNTAKYEAVPAAQYLGELNGKPQEPNEAARPQPEAQRAEAAAPAAAPAPAAPAVVPGAGGATDEAGRLKPTEQNLQQRLDDARRIGREAAQRGDRRDPPQAFTAFEKQSWRAGWDQGKQTGKPTPQAPPLGAASTPERRKDLERRKRVNEMTPDEMRAALLTDDLTGLNNGRWLRENRPSFSHIIAFDADSLKWVNDNMGHEAGDMLLKAWGVALQQATPNSARMGGDEFFALANSSAEAQRIASAVEGALAQAVITASTPDGDVTIRGIGASFGIAQDRKAADEALNQHKRDREAAGTRAGRGEQPPGTSRKPASGQQDQADRGGGQDDPAGQEVAPPALTPKAQAVKEALADRKLPKRTEARGKARHPRTVMGSRILAIVSSSGGLDPSLLSEFSERVETGRKDKNGLPTYQWRNPLIPGVGRLFRRGGTSDYSQLGELMEEAGYLPLGSSAADYKEAGENAKQIIRDALGRVEAQTQDEIIAEAQDRRDQFDRESEPSEYADLDPETAAEMEAERRAIMAENDIEPVRMDATADDDIPWDAPGLSGAAGMRASGMFSEQEIADAEQQEREALQQGRTGGQARQDGPRGAQPAAEAGSPAARPSGEEKGLTLTAQTPADLKAKTEREDAAAKTERAKKDADQARLRKEAEARDLKARADQTVDDFQLGQDAGRQMAGMGDLFSPAPAPQQEAEAPAPAAPPAEQAAAILNAAAEPPKGAERLSVIKDVKAGAITPEEVAAAYPAKPQRDNDVIALRKREAVLLKLKACLSR